MRHPAMRASLLRNGVLGLAGVACSSLGNLALALTAARALGPAGSGLLFATVAIFTVVVNATKAGADTALVRFVATQVAGGREDRVPRLLRLALPWPLLASLVAGLVLLVGAPWLADVLYEASAADTATTLLRVASVFVPLGALTLVLLGASRGYGTLAGFVTVEQIVKPLVRPPLLLLAVALGGGVVAATVTWLVPVALGLLVAAVVVVRQLRSAAPGAARPAEVGPADADPAAGDLEAAAAPAAGEPTVREFWGFASSRAVGGLLEVTNTWISVILLSSLASSADAGIFTAAARVATVGLLVMVATRLALGAHVSAAFSAGDREGVTRMHLQTTAVGLTLCWPFFLLAAFFADPVLGVFGADFRDGATALAVVAAANLVNVAVGNAQTIVLMAGRASWNAYGAGSAVLTQLLLGLLLVPSHGLLGAGIAYAASIVVNNALAFGQVWFGLGLRIWSSAVAGSAAWLGAAFVAASLFARAVAGDTIVALVIAAVLGLALCAPRLWTVVAELLASRVPEPVGPVS